MIRILDYTIRFNKCWTRWWIRCHIFLRGGLRRKGVWSWWLYRPETTLFRFRSST